MKNHQNPGMPEFRRQAYLRILNDVKDFHPITNRLYFLDDHFPLDKLDVALQWLIDNRIIGRQFLMWFEQECQNSDLEMHRKLLTIVDNIKAIPMIVAHKNFRT